MTLDKLHERVKRLNRVSWLYVHIQLSSTRVKSIVYVDKDIKIFDDIDKLYTFLDYLETIKRV